MEIKLNIAEILKDKPQDTKLYSPLFGDVYLLDADNNIIRIKYHEEVIVFLGDGRYYNYPESEPLLFPSKEIRDWSKFAWKKGDVLISKGRRTLHVIFEGFNDNTYTTFKGKHFICDYLNKENCDDEKYYNDYHKEVEERTIEFEKDNINNAQTYINIIEKRLCGKFNRKTLEIEKTQPEFKDGDILFVKCKSGSFIEIFNYFKNNGDLYDHASLETTIHELDISGEYKIFKENIIELRLATEEEKQQLFDALTKEGKAWDAEKKQIIDLKPKVELKPFDKVLVRDSKSDYWRATLFSHINENGCYYCVWAGWTYCIPYEGNEHLLGTNKDVDG